MIRRLATATLVLLAASGLGTGAFAQDPVQRSFSGNTVPTQPLDRQLPRHPLL